MFSVPEALNSAVRLFQAGQLQDAEKLCREIVATEQGHAEAWYLLGMLAHRNGRRNLAAEYFGKVVSLRPNHVDAHNNLGKVLWDEGRVLEAEQSLRQALLLKPDHFEALCNLGVALLDQDKFEAAQDVCEQALRLKPESAKANMNLGNVLHRCGKLSQAIAMYQQALLLEPNYPEAHNNLGYVLQDQGKLAEAVVSYERALRLQPDYRKARNNLTTVLVAQGKLREAEDSAQTAVSLHPDHAEEHYDRAHIWLLQGDFARGWPEYEWRWRLPILPPPKFTQPHWRGENLTKRTILLHAEQGLGDTLQFVRFIPQVKAQGGTVLLQCQPALRPLLDNLPGTDRVLTRDEPLPPFDVHAPLLSLPHLLGMTSLQQIPATVPYIDVDAELVRRWKNRLDTIPGFRVGIVWAGSPKYPKNRWRSVSLRQFTPLAEMAGVSLISLQYGNGSEQLEQLPGRVVNLGTELAKFTDTAAVLKGLDLVITVDTVVAHLAGALGVPVWVALPFAPDWRWLVGRDDSPWYPSMRLFRQQQPENWDGVFARLKLALAERLATRAGSAAAPLAPDAYERAVSYYHSGNLRQAEELCQQIERRDPRHVAALDLLGLLAHRVGKFALASHYFSAVLGLKPDYAEAHCNLGVALRAQGKLEEAVASWRQAVLLKPDYVKAHNNLGLTLQEQGRLPEAVASLQRAAQLQPENPELRNNLGIALQAHGNLAAAVDCFRTALHLKPDYAQAHNNLGNAMQCQKKLAEAAASYQQALHFNPDYAEARNNLAIVLKEQGKPQEAVASLQECLRLKPDYVEACNNLATILREQGQLQDAADILRRALHVNPDHAEAHNGLGCVLMEQDRLEDALASVQQALRLKPDFAEALNNLALVYREQGKFDEALTSLQQSLRHSPEFAEAHVLLGMLWLQQGEFERGWAEYEWRSRLPKPLLRSFPQPFWQGGPLRGRTILLHAEQGLGDTIQFLRYAAMVKASSGGIVLLECPPALARLLHRWPGADRILVQGDSLPAFDVHAPLLSLPRLLGTSGTEHIPADMAYLYVGPDVVEHWRERLQSIPGFRVGIAWQGNPKHPRDKKRSVPLERFAALAGLDDINLVSLQTGQGSDQLGAMPGLAVNLGAELIDLADTAAALMNVDLVVTVDTALAHLAGALGVPCWVVLSFVPDWRWLLDREDSPWYPSLRLFRQPRPHDWDDVFARVEAALKDTLILNGVGA